MAISRLHSLECLGRQSSTHQFRPVHVRYTTAYISRPKDTWLGSRHDRGRLDRIGPAVGPVDCRLAVYRGNGFLLLTVCELLVEIRSPIVVTGANV